MDQAAHVRDACFMCYTSTPDGLRLWRVSEVGAEEHKGVLFSGRKGGAIWVQAVDERTSIYM